MHATLSDVLLLLFSHHFLAMNPSGSKQAVELRDHPQTDMFSVYFGSKLIL